MSNRIAGTAYIKVDGAQLEVTGGVELPATDVTREIVMGVAGPAGYKETARKPFVKVSAAVNKDFPLQLIKEGTEITVTAELATGRVYVLSQAWVTGDPSIKNDDGTVDLEFEGMKGIWQ